MRREEVKIEMPTTAGGEKDISNAQVFARTTGFVTTSTSGNEVKTMLRSGMLLFAWTNSFVLRSATNVDVQHAPLDDVVNVAPAGRS